MTTATQTRRALMTRRPYPRLRLIGGVVVLLIVGGATLGDLPSLLQQERTVTTGLPESMSHLILSAPRGDVRVSEIPAGDQPSVQMDATWTLSLPQLSAHEAEGNVRVEAPCSGNNLGECNVDFTVWVPAGTTLEVKSTFGDVHLSSTGDVTAQSTLGDIRLDGDPVRGSLTSTVGSVRVDTPMSAPEALRVRTTLGDVDVVLPGRETYAVSASSTSGSVQVQVPRDVDSTHTVDVDSTLGTVDIRASD